jgi:ribonuclease VapC
MSDIRAEMIEISAAIGLEAIKSFGRFGKGRHKTDLNMGDCLIYDCARSQQLPLLFKGNGFAHTDIDIA